MCVCTCFKRCGRFSVCRCLSACLPARLSGICEGRLRSLRHAHSNTYRQTSRQAVRQMADIYTTRKHAKVSASAITNTASRKYMGMCIYIDKHAQAQQRIIGMCTCVVDGFQISSNYVCRRGQHRYCVCKPLLPPLTTSPHPP